MQRNRCFKSLNFSHERVISTSGFIRFVIITVSTFVPGLPMGAVLPDDSLKN